MKKILLIGYPFPLRRGGSPRLLGLAKYLPEFGWEPVILTAPLDQKDNQQYRIIETGYDNAMSFWGRLLRFDPRGDVRTQIRSKLGVKSKKSLLDFLMTTAGEIINYPDNEKGWRPHAIRAAQEFLKQEHVDAILSTSAPLTTHLIANKLKAQFNLPWAADLRDLWSQNHNYSYSRLRRYYDKRLELKVLSAADVLVTVSQPWAEELGSLHKGKTVYSITNGFDPDSVNEPPVPLSKKFTITYTGVIYAGKEDPTLIFKALGELISENIIDPQKTEIRFYGSREEWLEKEAAEFGLGDIVQQYGMVPRDESLKRQRESQLLLLLNWDDPHVKGTVPGKIFEYMAALRPVIAVGGSKGDVIQKIMAESGIGLYISSVAEAKEWLKTKYTEFINTGKVAPVSDIEAFGKYNHREMTRKYAGVLALITS